MKHEMPFDERHHLRGLAAAATVLALAWSVSCHAAPAASSPHAAGAAPSRGASMPGAKRKPAAPPLRPLDLNSASRRELKTLPGIGDAEAEKIVASRPFLSKTELVTKKIVPAGYYAVLKNRVVVEHNDKLPTAAKGR